MSPWRRILRRADDSDTPMTRYVRLGERADRGRHAQVVDTPKPVQPESPSHPDVVRMSLTGVPARE